MCIFEYSLILNFFDSQSQQKPDLDSVIESLSIVATEECSTGDDVLSDLLHLNNDKIIAETLRNDPSEVEKVNCGILEAFFIHGFDNILNCLIENYHEKYSYCFAPKANTIPILLQEFKAKEEVILRVLQYYKNEVCQVLVYRNQTTNDNLIHTLAQKGFTKAIEYLIDEYDITEPCLDFNIAGNCPLTVMLMDDRFKETAVHINGSIQNKTKGTVLMLWDYLVSKHGPTVSKLINHLNAEGVNMLFLCAFYNRNELLLTICQNECLEDDKIVNALMLNKPN